MKNEHGYYPVYPLPGLELDRDGQWYATGPIDGPWLRPENWFQRETRELSQMLNPRGRTWQPAPSEDHQRPRHAADRTTGRRAAAGSRRTRRHGAIRPGPTGDRWHVIDAPWSAVSTILDGISPLGHG